VCDESISGRYVPNAIEVRPIVAGPCSETFLQSHEIFRLKERRFTKRGGRQLSLQPPQGPISKKQRIFSRRAGNSCGRKGIPVKLTRFITGGVQDRSNDLTIAGDQNRRHPGNLKIAIVSSRPLLAICIPKKRFKNFYWLGVIPRMGIRRCRPLGPGRKKLHPRRLTVAAERVYPKVA